MDQIDELCNSFRCLSWRYENIDASAIKKEYREDLKRDLNAAHDEAAKLSLTEPGSRFISPVLYTKKQLLSLSDGNKVHYMANLLVHIASVTSPYFDGSAPTQSSEGPYRSRVKEILDGYSRGKSPVTVYETYVVMCWLLRRQFLNELDALCLSIGLDVIEIQSQHNLQIHKRDASVLHHYWAYPPDYQPILTQESGECNPPIQATKYHHRQAALICYYNKVEITKNNAASIAEKYTLSTKDGAKKKLLETFAEIKDYQTRIRGRFFIRDVEFILPALSDSGAETARKELEIATRD